MLTMDKRLSTICSLGLLTFAPAVAQQSAQPFRDPALPMEKRIDSLLSQMTLEEKIDCLGTRTGVPRLGVPSFGSSEGIHGVVQRGGGNAQRTAITTTQFPQPPGMGETWDAELVQQAGAVEGYEARFITQTEKYNRQMLMLWGPQADLARDPRWGRSEEVYGEDPFFNGTMVVAFVKGLQGDDRKYWQSAALLKHFLANSNEMFRTSSSSNFDQRLFWEYYAVPFRMGFLEGGAKGVMASYNAWNGAPMAVNPVLKNIVRDRWGVDVLAVVLNRLEANHRREGKQTLGEELQTVGAGSDPELAAAARSLFGAHTIPATRRRAHPVCARHRHSTSRPWQHCDRHYNNGSQTRCLTSHTKAHRPRKQLAATAPLASPMAIVYMAVAKP
jgi:hypothetical protein